MTAQLNSAIYERTSVLVGDEGLRRLQAARVLVVGIGGVGGHCAEALVRSGVGTLYICDHDVVSLTNKNRQLAALDSTVGQSKARVLAHRFADINRACKIHVIDAFLLPEDIPEILERESFDCVVDAIDSVECKVALVAACACRAIPVFVSGGAGGKMDATAVKVSDLFDTEGDALLRILRTRLRKLGVSTGQVECVHSTELSRPPLAPAKMESGGRDRSINGTVSYLPPLFGLMMSSRVIQFLIDPVKYRAAIAAVERKRVKEAQKQLKLQQAQEQQQDKQEQNPKKVGQQKQKQLAAADSRRRTRDGD